MERSTIRMAAISLLTIGVVGCASGPVTGRVDVPGQSPVPLTMKVLADTREDALVCVLEHMKKLGKISDYHVDENEKPKPPAVGAPKKAADEDAAE